MNAVQLENNYYTVIDGVNMYVDYYSSRLKIVDNAKISKSTIKEIINFARKENLEKIIANCTVQMLKPYIGSEFVIKGYVKGFLRGEDAYFISYYINRNRAFSSSIKEENEILSKISIKKSLLAKIPLNLNAEITDCATYENFRGRGLFSSLIIELEKDLKVKGFITA